MTIRTRSFAAAFGLAACLAASSLTLVSNVYAAETATPATSIKTALELRTGKQAKIKLVSGQDLEGRVQSVGAEVVVIAELTGMEFFSATVRIDQVAAVISRTETP